MKVFFAAVTLILSLSVVPISAENCYDYGDDISWSCDYTCCFDYDYCCNSFASVYWYAWVIMVIFILLCVCACAGGGYGYRRYYVRRVYYPVPASTTVVTATTANQVGPNLALGLAWCMLLPKEGYTYPQQHTPAYNPNMGGYQQAPPKY